MISESRRHRLPIFLPAALVLAVLGGVVGFVPLLRCPTHYCSEGYHEAVRCLSVATNEHYAENVRLMYEDQVRNWRCERCTSRGRMTLFQWLFWRPPMSQR